MTSDVAPRTVRLMLVGDIFGEPGRRCVRELVPGLRAEHELDAVVINAENATRGLGITARNAQQLLGWGADGLTLGNHAFRQRDIFPLLNSTDRIVRPANFSHRAPGVGVMYLPLADELRADPADPPVELAVINLMGSLYLDVATSAFEIIDELVEQVRARTPLIVVDMHAEATSEKVAMGRYLDGRVTAVVGTHTHVQTSDARILAGGTAYLTDLGMTGPHDSVIGVRGDIIIRKLTTGLGERFEPADGGVQLEGAIVDADVATGLANAIRAIRVPLPVAGS